MKNRTAYILFLAFLLPVMCLAHSDPRGEVNPYFVERDGSLLIYFSVLTTNGYTPRCARVHPEGRLVDKRPVERGEHSAAIEPKWEDMTWDGKGWVSIAHASDGPGLVRLGQGKTEFIPLVWGNKALARNKVLSPTPHDVFSIDSFWAVSVERWETDTGKPDHHDDPPKLSICWFEKKSRRLQWEAILGRPVRIMATQVHSPVVEWKGKPVLAFLEPHPTGVKKPSSPMKAWRIILATFDVANQKLSKQTIVPEANWNTHIDLHVWNGALWLVHHDVDVKKEDDFEMPTEATIRLKKIEEVSNKAIDSDKK